MGAERRNELFDSPLHKFVKNGWARWSQEIGALQVIEDDFLLYLAWALETIKQQDGEDINTHFRDNLYSSLRDSFIASKFTSNKDDLNYLTNLVCAASLSVLGLVLTNSTDNQKIYSELVNGFGKNWDAIRMLKSNSDMDTHVDGLNEFALSYMNDSRFFTYSDTIEWNDNDMAERLIRLSKNFDKVDLYRVIIALYEINAFESADESKLSKKKVFQAFGDMLGEDFKDFNNNLSSASTNKTDADIFQRLEKGLGKYEQEKDDKLTKQGKQTRR